MRARVHLVKAAVGLRVMARGRVRAHLDEVVHDVLAEAHAVVVLA